MTENLHKNCGRCRWFNDPYTWDEDEPREGYCGWPSERLPWSLRYGNRERMAVSEIEGTDCSQFEEALADGP